MQRRKPYEVHFNPIDTNIERKIVTRTIKNYNSEQKSPNIVVYPPLPKNSAIKPLGGLMTREAQYISSFQNYDIKNNQMPNDKKNQKNQMKWVMIIMNVMFGFMALSNTTLGIYWLIGAVYQIFQSEIGRIINNKKYEKMQARPDVF